MQRLSKKYISEGSVSTCLLQEEYLLAGGLRFLVVCEKKRFVAGLFFGKWACLLLALGFLYSNRVLFVLEEFFNKHKVALTPQLILKKLEFPLFFLHFFSLLWTL